MRLRIDHLLLVLLMMSLTGPAVALSADDPGSAAAGLPAAFAVTFEGIPGDYMLVLGDVALESEVRTDDGWIDCTYAASFEIRERLVATDGAVPGELLAEGRFGKLKTHRPAAAEGGSFDGVIEIVTGRTSFDSPGKTGTLGGSFAPGGPGIVPWGRVTWTSIRDTELTGTADVSWSDVKNRFR